MVGSGWLVVGGGGPWGAPQGVTPFSPFFRFSPRPPLNPQTREQISKGFVGGAPWPWGGPPGPLGVAMGWRWGGDGKVGWGMCGCGGEGEPDKLPIKPDKKETKPEGGVLWESVKPGKTSIGFPKEERGTHLASPRGTFGSTFFTLFFVFPLCGCRKTQELKCSKGSLRVEIGACGGPLWKEPPGGPGGSPWGGGARKNIFF